MHQTAELQNTLAGAAGGGGLKEKQAVLYSSFNNG